MTMPAYTNTSVLGDAAKNLDLLSPKLTKQDLLLAHLELMLVHKDLLVELDAKGISDRDSISCSKCSDCYNCYSSIECRGCYDVSHSLLCIACSGISYALMCVAYTPATAQDATKRKHPETKYVLNREVTSTEYLAVLKLLTSPEYEATEVVPSSAAYTDNTTEFGGEEIV